MINVAQLGTCRTHGLLRFNNSHINFVTINPRVHTTKEALQYIDKILKLKAPIDLIMVEISTLKLFFDGRKYVFANSDESKGITPTIQTEEDFAKDVEVLESLFAVPVLFVGHMNLNFPQITSGVLEQRAKIDSYIRRYAQNYLILKDVFQGISSNYITLAEDDVHHFSQYGYDLLYSAAKIKIDELVKR